MAIDEHARSIVRSIWERERAGSSARSFATDSYGVAAGVRGSMDSEASVATPSQKQSQEHSLHAVIVRQDSGFRKMNARSANVIH